MHKSDLQDYRGAIQDYNNAIDFDYLDAYINRAGAKHKLYDYRGAIQDCNKAIELKPDFSMAYINLSLLNLF
jgi:tetratricopeptide (TPR) repeat protein